MKYLDIRVLGLSDTDINEFLHLLVKIETLGEQGANRTIPVCVDGDGSGIFKFDILDKKLNRSYKTVKKDIKTNFTKEINDKIKTHYIGE